MRRVFADTLYWIAAANPFDSWRSAAQRAKQELGPALLVTADEVLSEFMTAMSHGGSAPRQRAVQTVRAILASPEVQVIEQSHDGFLKVVDRYERRPDKSYSLTDCSSMNSMDAQQITDILTNDHHFSQEGYNVLVKRS